MEAEAQGRLALREADDQLRDRLTMTDKPATELKACGCGGKASRPLPYGSFERDMLGKRIDKGSFIECNRCAISVFRRNVPGETLDKRHNELQARWNLAMSSAADPLREKLVEALEKIEVALRTDSRGKSILADTVEYHLDGQAMYHAINAARAALRLARGEP